jgi:hypothetical protein
MGCENCTVRKMLQEGCCTNDVGFGTKMVKIGLRVIEVCQNLQNDHGKIYCETYYSDRSDNCGNFNCDEVYAEGLHLQ